MTGEGVEWSNLRFGDLTLSGFCCFMLIVILKFATLQVANWKPIKNAITKVAFG